MADERFQVERVIPVDPGVIFEVLRSPQGHVAIDSSGMLMSAEGSPAQAVGDSFVVHMDRDSLRDVPLELYDVTVSITRFEQDRHIEWTILSSFLDPPVGHVFGYHLQPTENGTLVDLVLRLVRPRRRLPRAAEVPDHPDHQFGCDARGSWLERSRPACRDPSQIGPRRRGVRRSLVAEHVGWSQSCGPPPGDERRQRRHHHRASGEGGDGQ